MALCLLVSFVYALTTSEEKERIVKDTLGGFLLMFGGICLLGAVLMAIPMLLS